jgi:flagellar biosynthesis/type III secretory pathway M-ring protein FliF/YscJ
MFFALPATWAQKPSNLPDADGDPVDIFGSVKNILVYIVLPLIVLVLYLIWRKRTLKKYNEQQEQEKHQHSDQQEEKEEKSS